MTALLRVYEVPFLIECADVTVLELAAAVRKWSSSAQPVTFTVEDGFTFVVNFHLLPVVLITEGVVFAHDEDGERAPVVRVTLPRIMIESVRSENDDHLVGASVPRQERS
ncbi:hypothetical protein [Umezawaea sp. NPDC059074]|uniref:hypothetical protein n=1 Tax=Umezawaea sp. NPDC059074 TaxID=3346716 RepID=UPI0036B9D8D7